MLIKRTVATVLIALLATPTFATNSWVNTAIQQLIVQDGGTPSHPGLVVVIMPANSAYLPSCHTGPVTRFAVDLGRPAGKSQYAMLLAANVAKHNVTIAVNESCVDGYALLRNVEMTE